jgi:hypothetical protein
MEFCSKWFYSPSDTLEDINYSRDMYKTLTQKQMYTGRNAHILKDRYLHRLLYIKVYKRKKFQDCSKILLKLNFCKWEREILMNPNNLELINIITLNMQ